LDTISNVYACPSSTMALVETSSRHELRLTGSNVSAAGKQVAFFPARMICPAGGCANRGWGEGVPSRRVEGETSPTV
jgi:hypothetical protein